MPATQDVTLRVISSLITLGIGTLIAKGWGALLLRGKKSQRDFLIESRNADFVQKVERNLFRCVGLAIYALGAYLAFEIEFRFSPKAEMAWKFLMGLVILFCGGFIMANASIMNEYGINRRREAIEQLERKRMERKELENK